MQELVLATEHFNLPPVAITFILEVVLARLAEVIAGQLVLPLGLWIDRKALLGELEKITPTH
jgi:hypothetical protein